MHLKILNEDNIPNYEEIKNQVRISFLQKFPDKNERDFDIFWNKNKNQFLPSATEVAMQASADAYNKISAPFNKMNNAYYALMGAANMPFFGGLVRPIFDKYQRFMHFTQGIDYVDRFKVDKDGRPLLDERGRLISDPNGVNLQSPDQIGKKHEELEHFGLLQAPKRILNKGIAIKNDIRDIGISAKEKAKKMGETIRDFGTAAMPIISKFNPVTAGMTTFGYGGVSAGLGASIGAASAVGLPAYLAYKSIKHWEKKHIEAADAADHESKVKENAKIIEYLANHPNLDRNAKWRLIKAGYFTSDIQMKLLTMHDKKSNSEFSYLPKMQNLSTYISNNPGNVTAAALFAAGLGGAYYLYNKFIKGKKVTDKDFKKARKIDDAK